MLVHCEFVVIRTTRRAPDPGGDLCTNRTSAGFCEAKQVGCMRRPRLPHVEAYENKALQKLRLRCSLCQGVRAVSFFFQAEDGIRDLIVTGVQTCALPI